MLVLIRHLQGTAMAHVLLLSSSMQIDKSPVTIRTRRIAVGKSMPPQHQNFRPDIMYFKNKVVAIKARYAGLYFVYFSWTHSV
jgi:type IV secretory pathway protease TraF